MKDIVEFATGLKVHSPMTGVREFDPYPFQSNTLKALVNNDFNIIWKARQMGVTTMEMIYAFHHMQNKLNRRVLFLSPNKNYSKYSIGKLEMMYEGEYGELPYTKDNDSYIEFPNGSVMEAKSPRVSHLGNGRYSLIIIDEAAFVREFERVYGVCYTLLRKGGKMIITSTKNKDDDFFMMLFKDSLRMLNEFNPILLDYEVHPRYDDKWKSDMMAILGEEVFKLEYESW